MKHSPGNNFKCDKILSINVPLVNASLVNAIAGTYFLPDIPELTNKQILGVIGSQTIGNTFRDIQGSTCWSASFITLFGMNDIQLIEKFPLPALYNYDSTTIATGSRKIPPINAKINLRQSFIQFAENQNFSPTGKTLAIGLTFFYNYK